MDKDLLDRLSALEDKLSKQDEEKEFNTFMDTYGGKFNNDKTIGQMFMDQIHSRGINPSDEIVEDMLDKLRQEIAELKGQVQQLSVALQKPQSNFDIPMPPMPSGAGDMPPMPTIPNDMPPMPSGTQVSDENLKDIIGIATEIGGAVKDISHDKQDGDRPGDAVVRFAKNKGAELVGGTLGSAAGGIIGGIIGGPAGAAIGKELGSMAGASVANGGIQLSDAHMKAVSKKLGMDFSSTDELYEYLKDIDKADPYELPEEDSKLLNEWRARGKPTMDKFFDSIGGDEGYKDILDEDKLRNEYLSSGLMTEAAPPKHSAMIDVISPNYTDADAYQLQQLDNLVIAAAEGRIDKLPWMDKYAKWRSSITSKVTEKPDDDEVNEIKDMWKIPKDGEEDDDDESVVNDKLADMALYLGGGKTRGGTSAPDFSDVTRDQYANDSLVGISDKRLKEFKTKIQSALDNGGDIQKIITSFEDDNTINDALTQHSFAAEPTISSDSSGDSSEENYDEYIAAALSGKY